MLKVCKNYIVEIIHINTLPNANRGERMDEEKEKKTKKKICGKIV